jgi:hypothetical protein
MIRRGELRFAERLPNLFGDGEMTLWFHPPCAAFKRPQSILDTLPEAPPVLADRAEIERAARMGVERLRLPRIDGAERAPTGQARCRSCRELIERGSWRVRLVYYEEGRFSPGGFVHLGCRKVYFEVADILPRLLKFSPGLSDDERADLSAQCADDA